MKSIQEQAVERVRELLPELKELSFGCEVEGEYETGFRFISKQVADKPFYIEKGESCTRFLDEDEVKIIGHPVRLADILRAIDKKYRGDFFATQASNGWFHFGKVRSFYNLADDNLMSQSPEFCEELLKLIK
jgi:hypothetical protein